MPGPRQNPTDTAPVDRLRAVVTGRPGRGQLVVAALLALLGFAAAVQIRQTDTDDNFGGQSRQNLVALIDSLSSATDRANSQLDDLEQTRDELLTSSQRRQAALEESRDQLEVLNILTGSVAATGPGITIVVRDAQGDDVAAALLNGVEELRVAGAEAIEINDTLRVVASTSFTQQDGLVFVDDVPLRAPYVIDAVGEPGTLNEAMVFRGGFVSSIEALKGSAEIDRADVVLVSSLHQAKPDEYAHPTDR
ncbi:MAG: DUF881 domain-containing protein [Nocardioidaceae bacterium]|nr:DUF881 domain-containing protein [Nocardioidaceae bacterium]